MDDVLIRLAPPKDQEEVFEEKEKNILKVRIQLPSGEMISDSRYRVELRLSSDAMMGLGTELIRAAHNQNQDLNFWHLHPADKELATQILGVYLHPESCELLVAEDDLGDLDTVIAVSIEK